MLLKGQFIIINLSIKHPYPEEPTLSLSGFPQSEKNENKKCVKFCGYYELHNELKILPGWLAIKLLAWKTRARAKYRHIFLTDRLGEKPVVKLNLENSRSMSMLNALCCACEWVQNGMRHQTIESNRWKSEDKKAISIQGGPQLVRFLGPQTTALHIGKTALIEDWFSTKIKT